MRILLVQEQTATAEPMIACLAQQGYAVDLARSTTAAAEFSFVDHHDVIILDALRPDSDGVALCRQLRRNKVTAPILVVSELHSPQDRIAAMDAGADNCLDRPFHVDELLALVRSLLRRSRATESDSLRSGDVVMNLYEHRVSVQDVEVKLSAKEFSLLEYMLRNPERLLTRAMIWESVWDMNYEPQSNVIEVYISGLRRKIDFGHEPGHIETVVGAGYRFRNAPPVLAHRMATLAAARA